MSHLLRLRGRSALSPFRLEKLQHAVDRVLPRARISSEFWHFVQAQRPLSDTAHQRLDRLLTYGPRADAVAEDGELLLVVPRLGTISPWSSKATDIARHCGLEAIERIERGVAYRVRLADARARLTPEQRASLLPHIHDRMTETVLASFDDAGRLFHHVAPQPLETVELGSDAVAALRQANTDMGLALSDDEIQYLADSYARAGRNPTDVELMMFA
ncbi:MAG TPA: phosphoribosylformylglycinamidine synthase, partial [Burkholderiales bacterium]|nr:phosphoribosylformylglycinamidine synthase [Burkholderiales bacterium]